jgi:hypothetical protein
MRASRVSRLASRVGGALAVACVVACKDSPTGPVVPTTPDGSYALKTIGARDVPFNLAADGGYRLETTSGVLILRLDSTYVARQTTTEYFPSEAGVPPQAYVDSTYGRWTRVAGASTITLVDGYDQTSATANWTGNAVQFVVQIEGTPTTVMYTR